MYCIRHNRGESGACCFVLCPTMFMVLRSRPRLQQRRHGSFGSFESNSFLLRTMRYSVVCLRLRELCMVTAFEPAELAIGAGRRDQCECRILHSQSYWITSNCCEAHHRKRRYAFTAIIPLYLTLNCIKYQPPRPAPMPYYRKAV